MTPLPIEYLLWAQERHPRARIDLANSGVPSAPPALLGEPPDPSDRSSLSKYPSRLSPLLGVPEREIAPSVGTSHAIWQACVAVLRPGDAVCVESPGYEPLHRVPEGQGARVLRFERRPEEGFALDPDRAARGFDEGARLVLLSDPHNPSGVVVDDSALVELAERAEAHDAWVFVDEVYRAFDPSRRPVSTRTLHPRILAAASLTKVFGLGWARAGWLAAPPAIAAQVRLLNLHVVGMMPVPSAAHAVRALERLDDLRSRTARIVEGKQRILANWIEARGDVRWTPPPGGLFGLVRVDRLGDSRRFADGLQDETGVLVTPGSFFGLPDHLRVSWGEPEDRFVEGLSVLGRALDALPR